ncbi:spermidine synthase [Thalassotalea sp. HSM 43]|nr:spermidine synthase [Thalassotalea sp. HSM 43]
MRKFLLKTKSLALLVFTFMVISSAQAKVISEERSLYRNILVDEQGDLRCLKFSVKRKTSSQSCINMASPDTLVFDYTKYMMAALVFHPNPKRVLIIGLGGGTLSNTLAQMYPGIVIDNVEIDPAVIKVARKYFDFRESEQVKSYPQDGRIFIKRALRKEQQYDVVILDAFNGEYIPEHLLTKEFLQETQGVLSENGVLIANTFSSSKLYDHETATYHAVFGSFYEIEKGFKRGNRVIVATNNSKSRDVSKAIEQLKISLRPYGVDINTVLALMELNDDVDEDVRVLTDQYSPANLL